MLNTVCAVTKAERPFLSTCKANIEPEQGVSLLLPQSKKVVGLIPETLDSGRPPAKDRHSLQVLTLRLPVQSDPELLAPVT